MSPYTPLKEIELMQKVSEFDSKALEELYNRYSALLFALIKKVIKDENTAEEVLTDVFVIIWKKIDYFDFNTNNVYTWLVTLARNKAIDTLRRMSSTELSEYNEEYENEFIIPHLSLDIEPLDFVTALSIKDDIEKALNDLTDAQQYVIYLAYYEGLTQQEIASKLNIPLPTIKSKIIIALNNLWQNLNEGNLPPIKHEFSDYIIQYSLGSLDREDLLKFKKYRETTPEFAWKELGEYQNLISLLPAIVNFEVPPAHIKNKIARKLYRMREEVKAIRSGEIKNLKPVQIGHSESDSTLIERINAFDEKDDATFQKSAQGEYESNEDSELPVSTWSSQGGKKTSFETVNVDEDSQKSELAEENKPEGKESIQSGIIDFEAVRPLSKESFSYDGESGDDGEERNYLERRVYVKEKGYAGLITIILMLIFIVIGVIAYLLYTEKADAYEAEINRLNQQVDDIISENQEKVELTGITTLNNAQTINLNATDIDSNNSGKIIYSLINKRGYLYLSYLPTLEENRAYQLWGNISGDFISLLVFRPSKNAEYYPFTLPDILTSDIEFIVVESSSSGFTRPGKKIYLQSIQE